MTARGKRGEVQLLDWGNRQYDANGNVTAVTDPVGNTTWTQYAIQCMVVDGRADANEKAQIKEGRDIFDEEPKAENYKPYIYPHPLQGKP